MQGVPGFYVNDYGKWTVKFYTRTSGIVIPLRGADGLLHGLQIRLDHPIRDKDDPPDKEGAKYLPLTSTGKNQGVSAGTPVHFIGDPHARVVYVTEGALKADIAHALTSRTFVATVGANNSNGLDELFAFLHRNGTEEIIEAEDMDKYHCIASSKRYWERIERGESYLMFLRKTSSPQTPYYTMEVEPGGTVRQLRTFYDNQNDDVIEARGFLREWQAVVAKRITEEDRQAAAVSQVLRNQEFKQMRQDNVIIYTGNLAGQRLVDVLTADLMEAAA